MDQNGLSIPLRDTPLSRNTLYSIADGGIAPICLVLIEYHASIAEIPLWGWGVSHLHFACSPKGEKLRKGGGGIAPNWSC